MTKNGNAGYTKWWDNEPMILQSDPNRDNINMIVLKEEYDDSYHTGMQVAGDYLQLFPICEVINKTLHDPSTLI